MESLKIQAKPDSPLVNFNPRDGKLEIIGNSMPENSVGFYKPIMEWLKEYAMFPNEITELTFKMNLLNTSSTKIFAEIFKIINDISEKSEVKIWWYYTYGDDDIHEVGIDFKDFSTAAFELVAIKE